VKQKRKARTGFNPKTQQKIKIPAKTVVKFRVAKFYSTIKTIGGIWHDESRRICVLYRRDPLTRAPSEQQIAFLHFDDKPRYPNG
jgi:hypothetical protein